jgi:hypothetical protein
LRVLFDNNIPAPLRRFLRGHEISTAFELGWQELKNGNLLSAAEGSGFEVFLTADQSIREEQNLARRRISIVALEPITGPYSKQEVPKSRPGST